MVDAVEGGPEIQPMEEDLEIVADVDSSNPGTGLGVSDSQQNSLLSLDQAILRSIESCSNEELKRKMYSCILLVGGGSKFVGMERYLMQKIALQIPFQFRSDPTEIIVDAKDMSSSTTAWKGAAIMACLETAQELWILPQEWKKHGQKVLRERAPFPWA